MVGASSTDDIVIWGRKIFVFVSAFLSIGGCELMWHHRVFLGRRGEFAGRDIESKGIDMDCVMAPICFS